MNCSITLQFNKKGQDGNPLKIVLDGIPSDSVQDYMNNYSKLLQLVEAQGKKDLFIDYSMQTGTNGSIYTSKDMEGLKDSENFFMPNISYDSLRNKYGWLPELSPDEKSDMNILFVQNLKINGSPAPYAFRSKDVKGNPIYVVQARGLLDFSRFIRKQKAVKDFNPEEQSTPKELQTLLDNIAFWQANGDLFMRRFASYDTETHQHKGLKTVTIKSDPMVVAKELMLSYLRNPDAMYFYGMTGQKAGENLLKNNLHRIKLIKDAISAIRGIPTKSTTTNSTLANAVFSKLIYGDKKGAKILLSDFKRLVQSMVSKEQYRNYFRENIPRSEQCSAVNQVLNDLFYKNDDGTTNYDTKSFQVNSIRDGYIYFQRSFDSLADHYEGVTIESLPSMAQEVSDYKGYKIYKYTDNNNQTKYTFVRGLLTPQSYDYRINSGIGNALSEVQSKIDNQLGESSKIHKRTYDKLYSDETGQGVSVMVQSYMGQLTTGQVLRVLDYRLPLKSMSGFRDVTRGDAIAAIKQVLSQADLLDWYETLSGTNIENSPLLDDNEKVFLTTALLRSAEGQSIEAVKQKLQELINSYGNYRYYKVTNVQEDGKATLTLMSDINTSMTGIGSYLSVHNELSNFASKIEDRFGIDTRVMNTETLRTYLKENLSGMKDTDIQLLSQQRAFILSDSMGNPIILINSDMAGKSDIAHEYMHIFMGIVRANPALQEKYTQLLTDLVNTKEGQEQAAQYANVTAYQGLSQIDFMEEVAANVMGKYLTNPDTFSDRDPLDIFKSFLESNTFHRPLTENIIDFSEAITAFDKQNNPLQYQIEKANKTNTERLLTNFIQRNMGKQIKEDCN